MTIAERVQQYRIAGQTSAAHTTVAIGPFIVFLQATDRSMGKNVAFLHTPPGDASEQHWHAAVEEVRAAFVTRGCIPTIRWFARSAPHLASLLQTQGFSEHQRKTLMVCTSTLQLRHPAVAGLTFVTLTDASPLDEVRENLDVNEFGFNPATGQPAGDEQVVRFRATLQTARAFTARWQGYPAGAGMFTSPRAGVTELIGIATLEQYRRRGIAAALTASMASAAFTQGCDLVFLTAVSAAARRAYERAGFHPLGDELTYVASEASMGSMR